MTTLYFNGVTELNQKSVHVNEKGKLVGEPLDFVPTYVQGEGWKHDYREVNRKVNYKAFGSKHECDARCINASGRNMNCECACGGKNHGMGKFSCE